MAGPTDIGFSVITAVMVSLVWTYLYKDNPGYNLVEAASLGIVSANALILAVDTIQRTAWGNIVKGNWYFIFAFILGALYFLILAPAGPIRSLFRISMQFQVAMLIGIGVPSYIAGQFRIITAAIAVVDLNTAIWVIMILVGIFWYIWYSRLERLASPFGTIAKYIWYIFSAFTTFGGVIRATPLMAFLIKAAVFSFPAVLLIIGVIAIVIIDAVWGFDFLRSGPQKTA